MFRLPIKLHVSTGAVVDLVVEVEHELAAALKPESDGGRKITKAESKALGDAFVAAVEKEFGSGDIGIEKA